MVSVTVNDGKFLISEHGYGLALRSGFDLQVWLGFRFLVTQQIHAQKLSVTI